MLRSLLLMAFCLFSIAANAASIQKSSQESADDFAARYAPNKASKVVHVASATVWGLKKPVIIAFYENPVDDEQTRNDGNAPGAIGDVLGVIFVPVNSTKYNQIEIDTYGPEGVTAEINSVFFAKTDKTSEAKLFVMVSWQTNNGALYDTLIYEKPQPNSNEKKLIRFKQLSKTFGVECDYCPYSGHPDSPAKYKTAADVKAELRRLIK